MRTKRTQYLSDLHIANMANVARRHCRIGKVTAKPVAMAARLFRAVLDEKMPDIFRRRFEPTC